MGISVIPAPSAGGKIGKRITLTSGTSWTVPAGVTDINVTLYGGGGGGGGATSHAGSSQSGNGGTGGTTTFTGATSASGGNGGNRINWASGTNANVYNQNGTDANSNSGLGATGGYVLAENSSAQHSYAYVGYRGNDGAIISSNLTTTPGSTISYSIGAGGAAGASGHGTAAGGVGGSGKIEIEYWV